MNKNKNKKNNRTTRRKPRLSAGSFVNTVTNLNTFSSALRQPFVCSVPRYLQFVPDELDCWGRTDVTIQYTGSAIQATTWKINGPYNLFGPQSNWAGAFSANVPAGSAELLQTTTAVAAGATGFYSQSTIEDVDLQLEVMATPGGNAPAAYVLIIPSLTASLATVPTANLREQRGTVIGMVPGQVNTNASPVQSPSLLRFSLSMADLFGVPRNVIRDNPVYGQIPTVDPQVLGYLHVIVIAIDGVTTVNHTVNHQFNLHHRFRRPNIMNSAVPN